jgi:hypothetical protein
MVIVINLCILVISIALHLYFLIQYILEKESKYLKGFVNTAISNIALAGILTVVAVFRPDYIRTINLSLILWLMSGILMVAMLSLKIRIVMSIYRRSKDPANYHYNYFGKKVTHENVVKQGEVIAFFATMPFFLFSGAYFIARLVNLIMFGHL